MPLPIFIIVMAVLVVAIVLSMKHEDKLIQREDEFFSKLRAKFSSKK